MHSICLFVYMSYCCVACDVPSVSSSGGGEALRSVRPCLVAVF